MSLIKSNSALFALTKAGIGDGAKIIFLHFIQSMSIDINTNRINSKHIGNSRSLTDQFVESDVNLNITFINTKDFFNEFLLGFTFGEDCALKNLIQSESFHKHSLVLFNEDNEDLINYKSKNLKYYASLGNLYLENYSLSYKINSLPQISVDFVGNNLKVGNYKNGSTLKILDNGFQFNDWNGDDIEETDEIFSNLKLDTDKNADRLVYVMNGIALASSLYENSEFPGSSFSSFLDGIIQQLDIAINFKRKKFLFFNETNFAADRKVILPVIGSIKLSGISTNLSVGNLHEFFSSNEKFKIEISVLDNELIVSEIICDNIIIESYSYSINLNGFLEYNISCSFQASEDFIIKTKGFSLGSSSLALSTSNNQSIESSEGDSFTVVDFIKN